METTRKPAQTFPPGEYIQEEIEARGWEPHELAERALIPLSRITAILAGGRVGVADSERLGNAFGVSAALFSKLSLIHFVHGDGRKPKGC